MPKEIYSDCDWEMSVLLISRQLRLNRSFERRPDVLAMKLINEVKRQVGTT